MKRGQGTNDNIHCSFKNEEVLRMFIMHNRETYQTMKKTMMMAINANIKAIIDPIGPAM